MHFLSNTLYLLDKYIYICPKTECDIDMKNILLNQRKERDDLLSRPYLMRHTKYDYNVLLESQMIKLISGPRRVGKSTQALQILRDKNFAYLNFDDNELLEKWDEDLVMELLNAVYPNYKFLLLDEVQNLNGWDMWVSKLYRRGKNMIITGSNAKMLSSEMATVLTGRYIQVEMLPFSLEETFEWNQMNLHSIKEEDQPKATILCDDYLRNGGYPETVAARSLTRSYLETLFDSIIWKDIVKRHRVRNTTDLNNLAMYMLSNFCNTLSANELTTELGFSSVSTTKKFMDYLHEPFLFFYLPRYNHKLKLMKMATQKIYIVDNGFVAAKSFNLSDKLGRLLENQVFIELLRRGYDTERSLFYYRSRNNKETDFVLRNGTQVEQLIQVCYDMSSPKTEKREVDSLIECGEELKCKHLTIVTEKDRRTIHKKGITIEVVPIFDF